jgi:hypothetical protein
MESHEGNITTESHEGNITMEPHEGSTTKQNRTKASLYDSSKE